MDASVAAGCPRPSLARQLSLAALTLALAGLVWELERRGVFDGLLDACRHLSNQSQVLWRTATTSLQGVGIFALLIAVLVFEPSHFRRQLVLVSVLLGGGFSWALKVLVERVRPDGGVHSWPSGHATTAFVLALALSWGRPRLRPWLILVAFLLAASRVAVLRHWPSDVLSGLAVGFLAILPASRLPVLPTRGLDHGRNIGLLGLLVCGVGMALYTLDVRQSLCAGWAALLGLGVVLYGLSLAESERPETA